VHPPGRAAQAAIFCATHAASHVVVAQESGLAVHAATWPAVSAAVCAALCAAVCAAA